MKKYLLQNTLLAQALGDAFGYLVEFDNWEKIKFKTTYRVDYETAELVVLAAKAIKEIKANNPGK